MQGYLLIVDDEAELREVLSIFMEDEGIKTLVAPNGQAALEIITSDKGKEINAVLSDIKMPKLDGLGFLRAIREQQIEVPVILLTGYGDKDKAVEALKWGAFDFQDKPFDRQRLIAAVKSAMEVGYSIKNIEAEIDEIMEKNKVMPEDREKARAGIKTILIMKKTRRSFVAQK
jgi:DNA-binding NtrC family response regulator